MDKTHSRSLHGYQDFYKFGISHSIYKHILGLHKPKGMHRLFYISLILGMVIIANLA